MMAEISIPIDVTAHGGRPVDSAILSVCLSRSCTTPFVATVDSALDPSKT